MKRQRAQWVQQLLGWIRQILILNLIFVVIGFFWRLIFLFLFGDLKELLVLKSDLVHAFILGARFDFTVLCYINAIPLLLFWLFISLLAVLPGCACSRFALPAVFLAGPPAALFLAGVPAPLVPFMVCFVL